MFKQFSLFIILFGSILLQAQIRPVSKGNIPQFSNRLSESDSTYRKEEVDVKLSGKTKYSDYKIFTRDRDTTYVDTTLTINKYYTFNFIRKDNFELLAFHNQGQTYTNLAYNFDEVSLYPNLGARAKHFNYYEINDVTYYEVPTPTTELAWRTGLEQGQFLDALITLNLTKRHNISLAYKGLRSLGKYRNTLSSHGNFRMTYLFRSKNEKYRLLSHITAQDLYNQENGGLTPESIILFEANDSDFKDRGRMITNFADADNMLRGNRYFLEHDFTFWNRKDSTNTSTSNLKIGHTFTYESKHYEFNQSNANTYFGNSFTSKIKDKNHLETLYNEVFVSLKSPIILGRLKFMLANYNYTQKYKNELFINGQTIPQSISGNITSLKAKWHTYYRNIKIKADIGVNIAGNLTGNYIKAVAQYKKDSVFTLKATLANSSKSPNFNFILNQSDYKAYNWYTNFKNEIQRNLKFEFISDKWLTASAQITQLDNYTYFSDSDADGQANPLQYDKTVNYLKIKASKNISYKKFHLDNTLMYQKVASGSDVFKVPQLVTRNSLYYSNYVFKKKPMYLETGISFKYFTKYYANAYNPLLSEFTIQNTVEIGNFPIVNYFINARVRQTRIYFELDHINSLFGKKDYYTAPSYPYRDFVIRFGLVWNFFI